MLPEAVEMALSAQEFARVAALIEQSLRPQAHGAQLLGVPVVMTTALSAGPNGPQWNALSTLFSDREIIDRTLINAWQDPRVHEAITATALSCAAEGYDAYVVINASGRFDPSPSLATITRLAQAGVALVNARTVVLEMVADNTHPRADEIYAALPAELVTLPHAPGA